jgi:hypothetical protein
MEICKGMYGLPQAGILANKLLKKCLTIHSYYEQPHTPGLFKHKSHPAWFNLAVDSLVSSTLAKTTSSTYMMPYAQTPTTSLKTESAISTVALTSLGNMKKVMLTSPCPSMS